MTDPGPGYTVIQSCRSCGEDELELVLDLGRMPLADALVSPGSDRAGELTFPLTLVRCGRCTLVQILETVDAEILYRRGYPYHSSFSEAVVDNAKSNVEVILDREQLGSDSLVVEIASNDGYLLQWFAAAGVPVLGIDPAEGPADSARQRGVPTLGEFFDTEVASRLVSEGKTADVIIGNNVLAHVPDQNEFVAGIAMLLAPGGAIYMEFPYVVDLIENGEFDTIYHEHHCYFSVGSVASLFARHGLDLVAVEHLPIHGGSLRVRFERGGEPESSVPEFLKEEERKGVDSAPFYQGFRERVETIRRELLHLLTGMKAAGSNVAAYGAAAKGAILLNYCGIDGALVDYVVDLNPHKHGHEMPGVALPIDGPARLRVETPEYLLLLAWNFKDEIIKQQAWFKATGGSFIVPVPTPSVI